MAIFVANYVKGCSICQQNKVNTHPSHYPYLSILPPFKEFNSILVIVDHNLTKAALFYSCLKTCRRYSWNDTPACIPVFWACQYHYLWSRTSICLTCLPSPWQGPRSWASHEHCFSPPNRWSDGTNQLDTGRVPSHLLRNQSKDMSWQIDRCRDCSQYMHAWTTSDVTFQSPVRISTKANTSRLPSHR